MLRKAKFDSRNKENIPTKDKNGIDENGDLSSSDEPDRHFNNYSLKRKLGQYQQENKRLKHELAESNAKVNEIVENRHIQDLLNVAKKSYPKIDLFQGLALPKLRIISFNSDVSTFTGNRNPLQNDLILSEIMGYLNEKELKECRLVNKQWRSHAAKYFRTSHPPVLITNSRTAARFTQMMWASEEFPFSNIMIKNTFIPRFSTQFQQFGHHITTLNITVRTRRMVGPAHTINLSNVLNILRLTQNLENLELSGLNFSVGYVPPETFGPQLLIPSLKKMIIKADHTYFSNDVMEDIDANPNTELTLRRLFSVAPALRTLSLEVFGRISLYKFLGTLCQLESLEQLEFRSCMIESHIEHFVKGNLHLKSLRMIIHLDDCQLLRRFLTSQAPSLEELDLHISSISNVPIPTTTLPTFPKLHSLILSSSLREQSVPFVRSIDTNEFPVLRSLCVSDAFLETYFNNEVQTPEVTELYYETGPSNTRWMEYTKALYTLKESFPKLRKITLKNPTASSIGVILETTGDYLEELYISPFQGGPNINSLLTGINVPDWITRLLEKFGEQPVLVRHVVLDFFQQAANVGLNKLKCLKRLGFICGTNQFTHNATIMDSAGFIALLNLKALDQLVIYNGRLSESCISELRKRHKTVLIKELDEKELRQHEHRNHPM